MRSDYGSGQHRLMGFCLHKGQTGKKPLQLSGTDRFHRLPGVRRPLKPSPFEAAIVQPKTVVLPVQNLQAIPAAVAKDEKRRRKRVHVKGVDDQRCQRIDGFAHVGAATSQVHALHRYGAQHEAITALVSLVNVRSSKPDRPSIFTMETLTPNAAASLSASSPAVAVSPSSSDATSSAIHCGMIAVGSAVVSGGTRFDQYLNWS